MLESTAGICPDLNNLEHLFQKNLKWATETRERDPDFFSRLSQQQSPEYLWIGCSDSRVPATQIVDLSPGEMFVHRNIANVVVHSDLNCLSVIQFAVEILKIRHIIVCGHYGCGGIRAAMEEADHGLMDNWLRHVQDVARFHKEKLLSIEPDKRIDVLCELNVMEQVLNVRNTTTIKNARKNGIHVTVHGWIYDISNGILKDLNVINGY